jgi:hypothetical protein
MLLLLLLVVLLFISCILLFSSIEYFVVPDYTMGIPCCKYRGCGGRCGCGEGLGCNRITTAQVYADPEYESQLAWVL